ncbi:MAG: hypothetical protein LUG13_05315 [Oscillospiraceae bacterium]|nr:hypothetical protein [Oscillospiraceae bacterium]
MDYRERIRAYIDRAFAGAPQTDKVRDTKAELYADLLDQYNALLEAGHAPQSAYDSTIESVGDIYELVDSLVREEAAHPAPAAPPEKEPPAAEAEKKDDTRGKFFSIVPVVAAVIFLLLLVLDIANPPGPKSILRNAPYLFLVLLAIVFAVYLWQAHRRGLRLVGDGIQAKWYPVFVAALWVAALICLLVVAGKPHLHRLTWIILIVALAVHWFVSGMARYQKGDGGSA